MNTKEAADRLGVSLRRVQAMITQGLLPAQKFGRDWILARADVERLQRRERRPGRPKKIK